LALTPAEAIGETPDLQPARTAAPGEAQVAPQEDGTPGPPAVGVDPSAAADRMDVDAGEFGEATNRVAVRDVSVANAIPGLRSLFKHYDLEMLSPCLEARLVSPAVSPGDSQYENEFYQRVRAVLASEEDAVPLELALAHQRELLQIVLAAHTTALRVRWRQPFKGAMQEGAGQAADLLDMLGAVVLQDLLSGP
ncbi:unnamed protein product, partial [Amoebophrya sp. A120]